MTILSEGSDLLVSGGKPEENTVLQKDLPRGKGGHELRFGKEGKTHFLEEGERE